MDDATRRLVVQAHEAAAEHLDGLTPAQLDCILGPRNCPPAPGLVRLNLATHTPTGHALTDIGTAVRALALTRARAAEAVRDMSTAAKIAIEVCCSKSKRTRARWPHVCGPSTAIELYRLELLNNDAEPTLLGYVVAHQLGGQHGG